MHRIFVYGTLLEGLPNHARMAGARLLGPARTRARYLLVDLGDHPGLMKGGSLAVAGEVYEVDAGLLAALDEFEGHPHLFTREPVALVEGEAEAYFLGPYAGGDHPLVRGGDWRVHWRAKQGR